jgi:hypothetical protein
VLQKNYSGPISQTETPSDPSKNLSANMNPTFGQKQDVGERQKPISIGRDRNYSSPGQPLFFNESHRARVSSYNDTGDMGNTGNKQAPIARALPANIASKFCMIFS